jgi:hypothetical protein
MGKMYAEGEIGSLHRLESLFVQANEQTLTFQEPSGSGFPKAEAKSGNQLPGTMKRAAHSQSVGRTRN